jgi:hypothetical protein
MKYKMELTQDQMLSIYTALDYYIDNLEGLIEEDKTGDTHFLEKELFVQKQLRNRISAKLIP